MDVGEDTRQRLLFIVQQAPWATCLHWFLWLPSPVGTRWKWVQVVVHTQWICIICYEPCVYTTPDFIKVAVENPIESLPQVKILSLFSKSVCCINILEQIFWDKSYPKTSSNAMEKYLPTKYILFQEVVFKAFPLLLLLLLNSDWNSEFLIFSHNDNQKKTDRERHFTVIRWIKDEYKGWIQRDRKWYPRY